MRIDNLNINDKYLVNYCIYLNSEDSIGKNRKKNCTILSNKSEYATKYSYNGDLKNY